jgi:serine protease Do
MARARWSFPLLLLCLCSAPIGAQEPDLTPEDEAHRTERRSPLVKLYEKCIPSVVAFTFPVPKAGNPALNEFFAVPGVTEDTGVGSGFFIHEAGYVLTSAHAVSPIAMFAHLYDGKSYPVDVIGIDRTLDLAVLRVRVGRPVEAVPLARGNDVMIGESVMVLGTPHGLKQSCITGIVSGLSRDVKVPERELHHMIQLNAAINPGNSGGPVFNVVGEVLGVVAVNKQDGQSLGFAIPAETVRRTLPRLLDVERREGFVTGLTFAGDGSAKVKAVVPDSPAAQTGIQPGDVLRRIEGRRILSESDFHLGLIGCKPGDGMALRLQRDKEVKRVSLILGKREVPDPEAYLARLGLKAAPLDTKKATAMRLRVPKGVVLTDVKAGLYPDKQKPEPGDVLARINDFRPDDLADVGRLLSDWTPGQGIRLVFLRQRENTVTRIDVTVTPSK